MEATALCVTLMMKVLLLPALHPHNCHCAPGADAAFPRIDPNRLQFFEYDHISISCEEMDDSSGWRVMRRLEEGPTHATRWETSAGSTTLKAAFTADSGEYWCEDGEGDTSSSANITVTAGDVILQSPAAPVKEGDHVTLYCRNKMAASNLPADFYKDGVLSATGYKGNFTISSVSQSDEGLYKCSISGAGESPESWLAVAAGSVLMKTPVLPVVEGDTVTLRCKNKAASANISASLYKDGHLIKNISAGNLTINCTFKSDEGLYRCNVSGAGESPESWMIVRDNHKDICANQLPVPLNIIIRTVAMISWVGLLLLLLRKLRETQRAFHRDKLQSNHSVSAAL